VTHSLRPIDGGRGDEPVGDDRADQVLERLATVIPGPPPWLRIVLAGVAGALLMLSLPWLVGADPLRLLGQATTAHLTRDGALGLAIATAGLLTAWRPRYSVAAAMVCAAALVAQLGTALIDEHYRRVSIVVETTHAITIVVTALVAYSSRPARPIMPRPSGSLRAVRDPGAD
jgi:hypothetical protein